MNEFHCMNHPDRDALHQCSQCGKPLCAECYDANTDGCRNNDHAAVHSAAPTHPPTLQRSQAPATSRRQVVWQIVVALLAVLGGLTLLLLAICGAMIFSY
ncbi:hypothetical protein [Paenibacillus sp. WLX2291]|uniref:hypothetical protein n=1 Tax=Paenibacillus sp. WLX2291 TaxID=3296934 RepID=UPI0039844178